MPRAIPLGTYSPREVDDLLRIDVSETPNFGATILALRSRLGRSQATVAAMAKLAAGYYSDIENNRRPAPPWSTALRLAAALELTPDQAACLATLADVDRSSGRSDAHLPTDVRALLSAVRLSAPRLTPSAISILRRTLQECCDPCNTSRPLKSSPSESIRRVPAMDSS